MKIAVSSYSFHQYFARGAMTQLDCVGKAKELGFDGIEFVGMAPHDGSAPETYAVRLAEACKANGLAIVNYCVGADFCNPPDGSVANEIERAKANVEIAAALESPGMRHDATGGVPGKSFDMLLPALADACRQVSEYAAQRGVGTMVENHGIFCQDSLRMERLYTAVNHPNFGLLADIGNFLCADEDPVAAVGRVAACARFAHVKDFIVKDGNGPNPGEGFFTSRAGAFLRGTIVGHGSVPVLHCLRALKRAGYGGFLSIEFEGMEDALEGIRIGLANLRALVAQL